MPIERHRVRHRPLQFRQIIDATNPVVVQPVRELVDDAVLVLIDAVVLVVEAAPSASLVTLQFSGREAGSKILDLISHFVALKHAMHQKQCLK